MNDVERIAGMPVVFLSGDARRIGEAHGRLLREEIGALRDELHGQIFGRHGRLTSAAFRWAALFVSRRMERHVPAPIRVEMEALARAAGVPYADVLLLTCFDDLLNVLRIVDPKLGGLLCSGFALRPERTGHGHVLHGRNLDYYFPAGLLSDGGRITAVLRHSQVLFVYAQDGAPAFLSLGWPGYVGTVTAVNERRLALSSLTSYLLGNRPWGEPSGVLYRRLMQQAVDLEQTERLLRGARPTIGNNLLVSSGNQEDARLFQITPRRIVVAEPTAGSLVCANHFLDPELRRRQNKTVLPHSLQRADRLAQLLAGTSVDPVRAQELLADTGRPDGVGEAFAAVANPGTLQSVVFSPAEERLWIAIGETAPVSQGGYVEVDVATLFRRARRPAPRGPR